MKSCFWGDWPGIAGAARVVVYLALAAIVASQQIECLVNMVLQFEVVVAVSTKLGIPDTRI
jgi:hypothetical protein